MNDFDDAPESDLDQAIAGRLAKLRTLPVDTSRLDAMLRAKIPQRERKSRLSMLLLRPMSAIAASVAILAVIAAILLSTSGGPVLASPMEMARVHEEILSGRAPVM